MGHVERPTVVRDQWTYRFSCMKRRICKEAEDTEFVQLNSFGCGLDAVTTDEVKSILDIRGKFLLPC